MSREICSRPANYASILVAFVLVLAAPPAIAHESGNHGTVKVHDEETASPPQRNEPHVDCEDFWVQGFNMSDGGGELVFYRWPPTGDKTEVMRADWSATSHDHEKGGFGFNAGPFMLDAGHYRVEAFVDSGHPGNEEHFSKAKMFWVEPCEQDEEPTCPTNLRARASANGDVVLTWTPAEGSDGTNIYRAEGEGDFEFLDFVGEGVDEYTDTSTEIGATYTYQLTALFGNTESFDCDTVEVTTIPELPTIMAAGLALVGGLAAYAGFRRRQA